MLPSRTVFRYLEEMYITNILLSQECFLPGLCSGIWKKCIYQAYYFPKNASFQDCVQVSGRNVYTKHIIVPRMLPSRTVFRYLEEENYVTLLHIKRDNVPTSLN
jgi:hypothetical protein